MKLISGIKHEIDATITFLNSKGKEVDSRPINRGSSGNSSRIPGVPNPGRNVTEELEVNNFDIDDVGKDYAYMKLVLKINNIPYHDEVAGVSVRLGRSHELKDTEKIAIPRYVQVIEDFKVPQRVIHLFYEIRETKEIEIPDIGGDDSNPEVLHPQGHPENKDGDD